MKNLLLTIKKSPITFYVLTLITAVLYLLLFSLWESPFYYHWYGCDSSFFSMAGRGITEGWVPYVDFFDLKGPYFFFLEALGQLIIKDRLGIFLLEIPFLWAAIILIYRIARMFVNRVKSTAILIIVLFLHIGTLWGGNVLEEYALPLNLCVLYLTLKYALVIPSENSTPTLDFSRLKWFVPFITGICFGIMLFAKVTVAAPIAGVVITVVIHTLLSKRPLDTLKYLGLSLLGVLAAALPIFIYFGYYHAIPEMLYSVFAFAAKRSVDYSETFNLDWELKTIGCYFAFLFAVFHPRKLSRPIQTLLLSMSVVTYLLLHLGVPFTYYFITVYPVFVLAMALFLRMHDPLILFTDVKQFVCLLAIGVMLYFYAHTSLDTLDTVINGRSNPWYNDDYYAAQELASLIPEADRDKVFSFSIDMTWFEANQMLPCYKYPINLQFFISLDPRIGEDLEHYLKETPPKWLVIGDYFEDEIPNLYKLIDDRYECVCSNSSGNLYLLQE